MRKVLPDIAAAVLIGLGVGIAVWHPLRWLN
jgi:hypothetical protein